MRKGWLLLLLWSQVGEGLHVRRSAAGRPAALRAAGTAARQRRVLLHATAEDEAGDAEMSMEEAFARRLKEEGGVVGLTAKTEAKKLAQQAKQAGQGATSAVGTALDDATDKLFPKVPKTVASSRGLLDENQWSLTVYLLGAVVLLTILPVFFGGSFGPPSPESQPWGDSNAAADSAAAASNFRSQLRDMCLVDPSLVSDPKLCQQ